MWKVRTDAFDDHVRITAGKVMNWIDERILERDNNTRRDQLIRGSAEKIFNSLWGEVETWIADANNKGFALQTNGDPYERVVLMPVIPKPAQSHAMPRKLTIKVEKDKSAIIGTVAGEIIKLDLDVCTNDVVCLKHEGRQVSMDEASRLLLEPLLFYKS